MVGLIRDTFSFFCDGDDYDIEHADRADDALAMLQQRAYDLVILLGLRTPWRTGPSSPLNKQSGIRLLKDIRALHGRIPVIVVSTVAEQATQSGAFAAFNAGDLAHLVPLALASG